MGRISWVPYTKEIARAIELYRHHNMLNYKDLYERLGISWRALVAQWEKKGRISFKQYKNLIAKGVILSDNNK